MVWEAFLKKKQLVYIAQKVYGFFIVDPSNFKVSAYVMLVKLEKIINRGIKKSLKYFIINLLLNFIINLPK